MNNLLVRVTSHRSVVKVVEQWVRGAAISQASGSRPEVALTFDDGPHPHWTPRILDLLDQNAAKATFFVVGRCVAEHPDLVREIRCRGHDIGTHLYSHDRKVAFEDHRFHDELQRSCEQLESLLNEPLRWLRFPYGERGRQCPGVIRKEYGLQTVHWTYSSLDGYVRDPIQIVSRVNAGLRPGVIILLHDRLADEGAHLPVPYIAARDATAAALPGILERVHMRGLQAVTLTKLLE